MNKKELKQLIKPMVREIMLECFTELQLDHIVSEAITKSFGKINLEQQQIPRQQSQKQVVSQEEMLAKRRKMLDEMHVGSSKPISIRSEPKTVLTEILQDTEESGFAIADGEGNVNPEHVPDALLDDLLGEMPDMSKFA